MVKKVLLACVFVFGVLAIPAPALAAGVDDGDVVADADATCFASLIACYEKAAKIDNFWSRWAAGLDCENKFTKCTGEVLRDWYWYSS